MFADASWSKIRASITANTIVAPDGALSADKLVEDSSPSTTHILRPTSPFSVTSGVSYTLSIFAKAAERTQIQLSFGTDGSAFTLTQAIFTLSGSGTATANGGSPNPAIASVGNGWFRCSISAVATTTTGSAVIRLFLANGGTDTYTGNGYSGIYIWGAQLEAGAFSTSYISTVASQVTRAADVAVMTGTNFSSWYNQAEGTLYAEWSSVGSLSDSRIVYALSDGTFNNVNYLTAATASAANQSVNTIRSSNTSQASIAVPGAYTNYTYRKTAAVYKVNDFALSGDGGAVAVDTSGLLPVGVDRLALGTSWTATTNFLGGHIKKIAYYPLRVTNAQLQGLTS
jgi:hypothetical protein